MNISPEHLDTVCEGCLSLERHLTAEVTDQHIKKLYFEILNITVQDIDTMTLRLCLECKANILKYFAFKKQVEEAHCILHKYLLKSSQSCTAQHSRPVSARVPSFKREVDHDGSLAHVRLAFIKVEDGGDDDTGDGDGEDFVHDGGSRDAEERKEFTAVLNPGLIAPNALSVSSSHTTYNDNTIYKENTTYKEEFDASDEEPLYHKKTKRKKNREERDPGERKRRKKEKDAAPKRDGRRHPRPRKEKPAGVVDNVRVRDKLRRLNVRDGLIEMRVLTWDEVEAERQKCLSSESFSRHQYRCQHCVLGFNHRVKLTNHMNKHHSSAGSFPCSVCAVRCKDQKSLAAHRRRHRVRWRCVLCGATSSRADVAADHLARAHGAGLPTHTCGLCGETAPSLAKLRNHMKNHGERQKCELCGKTFRDRNSLRTHLFIHAGCKEHSCPRCDKRFMFKKALQLHLVTHDEHAHLYCHECDVSFKNVISYNQHMKYSLKHVDPAKLKYVCPVCGKRFMKASRLEEHNLAVHLKLTPVSCTQPGCSFACSSRAVLRTHLRMIHRNGRAVRNHVCDVCGKTYTTKKSLEGHLRSHSGERPYSCGECGATFCYSAALYNHNKLVHHKPGRSRAKKAPPPPPPAPPPPPPPTCLSAAPPS